MAVFPRLLQFIEGGNIFNAINFNLEYNSLSGSNITAYSAVINSFICPSSTRLPSSGRDDAGSDPSAAGAFESIGYGVQDYGPTCYTDVDPNGLTGQSGSSVITPFRNKLTRANGLLKAGSTKIAECTDGLSGTIAIAEDAGRDSRYISPYAEVYYNGVISPRPTNDPTGYPGGNRRYWRWAEPDSSFGVSGSINNKYRPMYCPTPWSASCTSPIDGSNVAGNNAGANDEIFSYHPGGANCLFGDGSVKFLKDSTDIRVLRKLVTLAGGEVVSASDY